jgi:hypothetical protein
MLAAEWDACTVICRECRKDMRAGSLSRHLADLHEIYQGRVVAEELLDRHEGVVYEVKKGHVLNLGTSLEFDVKVIYHL